MTSIGREAFHRCSGLTSIEIPDSVTSIGGEAFHGCSGLTSIKIPEGVTSIGSDAFKNCEHLEIIIAPAHLHKQLTKEYPEKKVITLLQAIKEGRIDRLDDRLVEKIQKHIQRGLNDQDKQQATKMVQA